MRRRRGGRLSVGCVVMAEPLAARKLQMKRLNFYLRASLSSRCSRRAALPCFAGEVAVLKNGFSIRHERREIVGDTTRLYVNADGSSFVDVPTAEIEHYEAAPDLPASAVASAVEPSW